MAERADGQPGQTVVLDLGFASKAWRKELLRSTAQAADSGYPANADLVIDPDGAPHLRQRSGSERRASAIALEKAIERDQQFPLDVRAAGPGPAAGLRLDKI